MSNLNKMKSILIEKTLKLDCGKEISNFPLAYETYGNLNEKKDKTNDEGMSKTEKDDALTISKRRVRLGLILAEIGRLNNIKVEEKDTQNAMMQELQRYPGREKEILDYFKKNPDAQNQLSGPVFEDKIIDFILELAEIKEKVVNVDDLYKEDNIDLKEELKKEKSNKSKPKVSKKSKY